MFKLTFARAFHLCACIAAVYGEAVFSAPIASRHNSGYGGGSGFYSVYDIVQTAPKYYKHSIIPKENPTHTDFIKEKLYLDLAANGMLIGNKRDLWVNQKNFVAEVKLNQTVASGSLPLAEWLDYDVGDNAARQRKGKIKRKGLEVIANVRVKEDIANHIMAFYRMCTNYKPDKRLECNKEKIKLFKTRLEKAFKGFGVSSNNIIGDGSKGKKLKKLQVRVLGSCSNLAHNHNEGISILNAALDKSINSILIMPNNVVPVRAEEDSNITLPMVDSVRKRIGDQYFRKQKTVRMSCHVTDYLLKVGKKVQYHINVGSAEGRCRHDYLTSDESACMPENKESLVFIIEQEKKTKVYILYDVVNVSVQCMPSYHWTGWFIDMMSSFKKITIK